MSNKKVNRKAGIHLHRTASSKQIGNKNHIIVEWYWILIAKNGKTIARSSETYKRKASAVKSIYVAASIFLDGTPYELIPYYDHTLDGTPKKHI